MADCLYEHPPNHNLMGSKRTAEFEENQAECIVRYNKKVKREPLTPPREMSPGEARNEVENPVSSPYFEVEDYMVRGYESDAQYSLYDLTPEEEWERQCNTDDVEVPRLDCDIDMM